MAKVVAKNALIAHSDSLATAIRLESKVTLIGSDVLKIEYVVTGEIGKILFPDQRLSDWKDDLWRNTCFEAFIAHPGSAGYVEFNFSPSRQYAVYRFEGYRKGMQLAHDLPAPVIYVSKADPARFTLDAWIDLKPMQISGSSRLGLSAVIEEIDGSKSYWALAHAPGPPDFHNRDCFIATLPAPSGS